MKIRIQDYNLRLIDILKYPVWVYALDEETVEGQDERTVRPYFVTSPLNPGSSYLIVRATFWFADGTQMKGLIKPVTLRKQNFMSICIRYDLSPILVTNEGQIHFGYGAMKPDANDLSEKYRMVGKSPDEIFPINFSSDIEVLNSITGGTLQGFMYFEETTKDFFHVQAEDILFIK